MKSRILFVDDIEDWCILVKKQLEKQYDFEVTTACNLAQALFILQNSEPYHVVIVDIGLSSKPSNDDGLFLINEIHQRCPRTPVIAYSGMPRTMDIEEFQSKYKVVKYLDRSALYDKFNEFVYWIKHSISLYYDDTPITHEESKGTSR